MEDPMNKPVPMNAVIKNEVIIEIIDNAIRIKIIHLFFAKYF